MLASAKILITGMPNTGKTTLLKSLKNVLVFARDGKPFSLKLPHVNVTEFTTMKDFLSLVQEKLETYNEKKGEYPETIVFDSVSRIFTDVETSCSKRFNGYEVWANVNKEIQMFLEAVNSMQEGGFNVVLIAHAVWDENAKKYIETCKGSFAKVGGFLSTVDYALNIDIVGNKRIITHKCTNLSRTLLEDIPDKEDANSFNLQNYIDKIKTKANEVVEWSI